MITKKWPSQNWKSRYKIVAIYTLLINLSTQKLFTNTDNGYSFTSCFSHQWFYHWYECWVIFSDTIIMRKLPKSKRQLLKIISKHLPCYLVYLWHISVNLCQPLRIFLYLMLFCGSIFYNVRILKAKAF